VSLGALGDVDSFDRFLELLASPERGEDQKSALRALGALGDARAVDVLLRAYAEGTHANVALDALRGLGVPALPQLLAFFEKDAALAKRQGPRAAFAALPTDDVVEALRARIEALPPVVDDVDAAPVLERAAVWWSLVDGAPEVQRALAPVLREKLGDAKAKPAKALLTRLAKAQEA
jgi:HEAT repeat protein